MKRAPPTFANSETVNPGGIVSRPWRASCAALLEVAAQSTTIIFAKNIICYKSFGIIPTSKCPDRTSDTYKQHNRPIAEAAYQKDRLVVACKYDGRGSRKNGLQPGDQQRNA